MSDKPIEPSLTFWNSSITCEDEKHMAAALYLLQKAIALRESEGFGYPTIHACLRDASYELECARQYWTKERWEALKQVDKMFDEPPKANS